MGCPGGGANGWMSYRNLGLADAELQGLVVFNDRAGCGKSRSRLSRRDYEAELGMFKVPTLRNVDLCLAGGFVEAYGHHGYFKSLEAIVVYYHWRA